MSERRRTFAKSCAILTAELWPTPTVVEQPVSKIHKQVTLADSVSLLDNPSVENPVPIPKPVRKDLCAKVQCVSKPAIHESQVAVGRMSSVGGQGVSRIATHNKAQRSTQPAPPERTAPKPT